MDLSRWLRFLQVWTFLLLKQCYFSVSDILVLLFSILKPSSQIQEKTCHEFYNPVSDKLKFTQTTNQLSSKKMWFKCYHDTSPGKVYFVLWHFRCLDHGRILRSTLERYYYLKPFLSESSNIFNCLQLKHLIYWWDRIISREPTLWRCLFFLDKSWVMDPNGLFGL